MSELSIGITPRVPPTAPAPGARPVPAAAPPRDAFAASPPAPGLIPRPGPVAAADAAWRSAVARIQGVVGNDLSLQKTPAADGLRLRPGTETVFMPRPGPGAKGTVVMFHGYTAAPWQYREMAQRFFGAGYNVYVPRMPGHGWADASGMPTGAKLPHPGQRYLWEAFIDRVYDDAASLGAPVYAVGLSGGANVALRLGEKYPEVKGVAAMSPYLGGNPPRGLLFPLLTDLDRVTLGAVGQVMDHYPWSHNARQPGDPTPHTEGTLGQALVMEEVGRGVKALDCPVQILSSDGDFLSGSHEDAELFEKCGGPARSGWYRFHADEQVPHAMLSPLENHVPGAVRKVSDVIFNFIDRGQRSQRG